MFPLPLCFFFVDIPLICISSKLRLTRFRYNRERINRVIRGLIIYTEQNKIKINISFLFQSRPSYSWIRVYIWIDSGGGTFCLNEYARCIYEHVIAVVKTICQFTSSVNGFGVANFGIVHLNGAVILNILEDMHHYSKPANVPCLFLTGCNLIRILLIQ